MLFVVQPTAELSAPRRGRLLGGLLGVHATPGHGARQAAGSIEGGASPAGPASCRNRMQPLSPPPVRAPTVSGPAIIDPIRCATWTRDGAAEGQRQSAEGQDRLPRAHYAGDHRRLRSHQSTSIVHTRCEPERCYGRSLLSVLLPSVLLSIRVARKQIVIPRFTRLKRTRIGRESRVVAGVDSYTPLLVCCARYLRRVAVAAQTLRRGALQRI